MVTQPGRIYLHNWEPLAGLANRTPWHVELIRGRPAATVYRLENRRLDIEAEDLLQPRHDLAHGGARLHQLDGHRH